MIYTGEVISFKDSTVHLQHKLYTFKMVDTRSMDENNDDFLKIVSYLSRMNVPVSEEVQAILLLTSFPSLFNSLKETLKYGKYTLSLEEVTNAASSKDQDMKNDKDKSRSISGSRIIF